MSGVKFFNVKKNKQFMQFYNGVSYFYGHYAFQFCLLQKVNDLREFFKRRQVKIFLIF